jgi:hypothetical protein
LRNCNPFFFFLFMLSFLSIIHFVVIILSWKLSTYTTKKLFITLEQLSQHFPFPCERSEVRRLTEWRKSKWFSSHIFTEFFSAFWANVSIKWGKSTWKAPVYSHLWMKSSTSGWKISEKISKQNIFSKIIRESKRKVWIQVYDTNQSIQSSCRDQSNNSLVSMLTVKPNFLSNIIEVEENLKNIQKQKMQERKRTHFNNKATNFDLHPIAFHLMTRKGWN